jgi:catechol 2,3-dioxygenase-like lactoylglutathione lyase family enzyme
MQFDHLMHWVPDLDEAVRQCAALGYPIQPGGRLGYGMHNALWRGRDLTAVKLIGVYDRDAWEHRPRRSGVSARDTAMAAGGGALQFAFEVDDLARVVREVRQRGVEITDPLPETYQAADGRTYGWEAAWVVEGPGWRPFFIRYADRRPERLTRARQNHRTLGDWSFRRVDLETPDPASAGRWLARVLGVQRAWSDGMTEVPASGCRVRFVPGTADRVTRVVLEGTEGPVGDLWGVQYERPD